MSKRHSDELSAFLARLSDTLAELSGRISTDYGVVSNYILDENPTPAKGISQALQRSDGTAQMIDGLSQVLGYLANGDLADAIWEQQVEALIKCAVSGVQIEELRRRLLGEFANHAADSQEEVWL